MVSGVAMAATATRQLTRRSRRSMAGLTGGIVMALVLAALALASTPPAALGTVGASLHGTVTAAGKPLGGAQVELFAGSRTGATELGHARTDAAGAFTISYTKPAAGVLYVQAAAVGGSTLR